MSTKRERPSPRLILRGCKEEDIDGLLPYLPNETTCSESELTVFFGPDKEPSDTEMSLRHHCRAIREFASGRLRQLPDGTCVAVNYQAGVIATAANDEELLEDPALGQFLAKGEGFYIICLRTPSCSRTRVQHGYSDAHDEYNLKFTVAIRVLGEPALVQGRVLLFDTGAGYSYADNAWIPANTVPQRHFDEYGVGRVLLRQNAPLYLALIQLDGLVSRVLVATGDCVLGRNAMRRHTFTIQRGIQPPVLAIRRPNLQNQEFQ